MRYPILLAICCLAIGSASAQDTSKISLEEAIAMGLKNSKNLRISQAKIDAAAANTLSASQAKLPNFTVSGSYLRLSSANVNINKTDNSGTGGPTNTGNSPSPNSAVYGIANISLPVYAGGRIKYGIESAKFLQQAAMLDAANDRSAVIFNITSAYVNLYKSAKAVQIVKQNLIAAKSRDTTLQNQEANGILARNDLLKSELQTSNVELTLMEAESNFKVVMVNMNLLLGLPEENLVSPADDLVKEIPPMSTYSSFLEAALQHRKDLQAFGLRQKANMSSMKVAKAEAYPTLALTGGYVAADIPGSAHDNQCRKYRSRPSVQSCKSLEEKYPACNCKSQCRAN